MKVLIYSIAFMFFLSCSDGSNFNAGKSKSAEEEDDDEDEDDDSADLAAEPAEIAGAFLYCAFWDSEEELEKKARTSDLFEEGSAESVANAAEIGCGLYDTNTYEKVANDNIVMHWEVMNSNSSEAISNVPQKFDADFSTIARVPIAKTSGSIVAKVRSREDGTAGYRIMDIANIVVANARAGIDILNALKIHRMMSNQKTKSTNSNTTSSNEPEDCDTICKVTIGLGIVAKIITPAAPESTKQTMVRNTNTSKHTGENTYKQRKDGSGLVKGAEVGEEEPADEQEKPVEPTEAEPVLDVEEPPAAEVEPTTGTGEDAGADDGAVATADETTASEETTETSTDSAEESSQ
jgi:hypothetical protein